MPFPSLLPSTLYHEDSSCAAYAISPAFQRSQPNTRKVVSCRRFSIVISSIPESLLPRPKSAVPYVSAISQPRSPRRRGNGCRNPSRRFLPSWNCIRARSSSTATNRVCCFRRQRAVRKAFACPKSRFLSTPPPSPFHLPGMNLFILPSSIPHAPPSQIFLLLNQTSHSSNLRLLHFSKYQPSSALP